MSDPDRDTEDKQPRPIASRNAESVLLARDRAEEALVAAREALKEESRVLEFLNETGLAIAAGLDLEALLQTATDAATRVSGAQFGAFFHSADGNDSETRQSCTLSGVPREAFEKFGLAPGTKVFDAAFSGEAIARSDDITQDPRYGNLPFHRGMAAGQLPVRSLLAVPVVSRSRRIMGRLFLGHAEPGVFTARAERLVAGIAAQAGIAVDNFRLYASEREARATAERMSDLKDEFLSTLSHELRTPLSAILGWAQVLRSRKLKEDETRRAIEIIDRNARAQTRLIEDLLDTARITAGQARLDVKPADPVAFIEAALETARPAAEARGIRLEKMLDPKAGPVSGDPARLQQVVWNLLSNAIKFTGTDGEVRVALERVGSHIEVSVSDNGIGIRPEFLPHVFDRFRQADSSSTRVHGGLGLGLALAKYIIEMHGGTLRAASPGEGAGATFTMQLPLAAVHRIPVAHAGSTKASSRPARRAGSPGDGRAR